MFHFLLRLLLFTSSLSLMAQTLPFHPIKRIRKWVDEEKGKSPVFFRWKGSLATASLNGIPSCQTISLVKLTLKKGIIFFLHKNQNATVHLEQNPHAVLNVYLQNTYREITAVGTVQPLSSQEKEKIWKNLPKHEKIPFLISDHISPLKSEKHLLKRKKSFEKSYQKTSIPLPETFVCFHLVLKKVFFLEKKSRHLPKREVASYDKDLWNLYLLEP